MADLAQQAQMLRSLHHGSEPLLLPNIWDVASAHAVAAAGFPVIATSSHAVAASLGFPDSDSMPAEAAFAVIARIAAGVDLPVTADLEAGYQLPASELVKRLLAAGAVGCNLEDSDHHGPNELVPMEKQAERLRAVREASAAAGVPVVINARIDVFLREPGDPESRLPEAVRRGKAYLATGADCLYPIGLTAPRAIETFVREVGAPVNIWLRPDGPSREELVQLGVARISLAAGLFRLAMAEVQRALEALKTG
ncbi:MAG: isocitrate lyase/phosphoenolpyruvate mutase family protein [Chloroflexota bacterium]|nr:isocitrate lyase/phosphoenolpyruvate mutase family protein [Chloroflexota bacterium]